jgi:hypothetical protein
MRSKKSAVVVGAVYVVASLLLGVLSFAFGALYLGGGLGDISLRDCVLCAQGGAVVIVVALGLYAGFARFRAAIARLGPGARIAVTVGVIVVGYGLGKALQLWVLFHMDSL